MPLQQSKLEGCLEILISRNDTNMMVAVISCGVAGVFRTHSLRYSSSSIMTGHCIGGSKASMLLAVMENLALILYVSS